MAGAHKCQLPLGESPRMPVADIEEQIDALVAATGRDGSDTRRRVYPNDPKEAAGEISLAPTLRRQTILTKPLRIIVAANYADTPHERRRPGRGSALTS